MELVSFAPSGLPLAGGNGLAQLSQQVEHGSLLVGSELLNLSDHVLELFSGGR